ncbi:MAG: hypothetical protein ACI9R3_004850 [Verrucomicrobiales bacterium]|jgi:hypothetical protein
MEAGGAIGHFMSPGVTVCLLFFFVLVPGGLAQTATNPGGTITLIHGQSGGGGPSENGGGTIVNDCSVSTGVAGGEIAISPSFLSYAGFIGQFYDITLGFGIGAFRPTIDENSTRQLIPYNVLDDNTGLAFDADQVNWSITAGPLTGIDTDGLASAGAVFEDTSSTVQATFLSNTVSFDLLVVDTLPDNFESYASDGLADAWQTQFFGQDNPDAGPLQDPDGDGQNNLFERLAMIDPTDPDSAFDSFLRDVVGQPDLQDIVFSPVFQERTYTVQQSVDLSANGWTNLSGTMVDTGDQRAVTDANPGLRKFYQIIISE